MEAVVRQAYEKGAQQQIVNCLLPLIGATDLDDWCDRCARALAQDPALWTIPTFVLVVPGPHVERERSLFSLRQQCFAFMLA